MSLEKDVATWRNEMVTIEEVMRGSRTNDQVSGYLASVLFPPLALAIDQKKSQKAALDERQAKVDAALLEQHALSCPA